jgi:hypothetical protein
MTLQQVSFSNYLRDKLSIVVSYVTSFVGEEEGNITSGVPEVGISTFRVQALSTPEGVEMPT